jgi:[acyl-carrier-protein] S-malonyltransferase
VPYAVIFPGQGAAVPGAGERWREHEAWAIVEQAEKLLDRPLGRLLLDADADELATTRASQLAVLLTSLMGWRAFSAEVNEAPVAFAGHSLGQITALLASQVVDQGDGLRLAARRADVTQDSADANPGRMAALVGAKIHTAEQVCADIDVWVANDNAPGQVVIAGTPDGLTEAATRAKALGVKRTIPLAVGHAFHTPLLADAAQALRPLLDTLGFHEGDAPVVANTDALAHADPDCWPEQLTRHLVEPVRWRECQRTLSAMGVDTFVEIGPGRVLAGLARRTLPEVRVLNVAVPDEARAAARQIVSDEPSEASQASPASHPLVSTPAAPPAIGSPSHSNQGSNPVPPEDIT